MRSHLKHNTAVLVVGLAFVGCGGGGNSSGSGSSSGASSSGASTGSADSGAGSGAATTGAATTGAATSGASTGTPVPSSGAGTSGASSGAPGSGATTGAGTGASSGAPSSGATSGATSGGASGSSSGSVAGNCGSTTLPLGHPDTAITYPTHAGYTLYLAEEFNQPLDLDNDCFWTWSDGGLSEGSVRFTKSQITFASSVTDDVAGHTGYMILTAVKQASTPSQSFAENQQIPTKPELSGELRTKYNNYRYGWYEARFKPPASTQGNYISTMFIFRTPKTISWREIDIELTPNNPNKLGSNVYFQNNANGQYNGTFADVGSTVFPGAITDDSTAFHTYAFEWTPTFVKWYVDGQLARTKLPTNVPIPDLSAKAFMNLWVFAGTPPVGFGGPDPTTNAYPMKAEYDYFRFYKYDGDANYPCGLTGTAYPACVAGTATAHPDNIRSKNNPSDGVTTYPN